MALYTLANSNRSEPLVKSSAQNASSGYHCGVRVEAVGGGAHYDHVNGLFHKIKARDLRRVGVRDDGDSISFYPEDRRARTT